MVVVEVKDEIVVVKVEVDITSVDVVVAAMVKDEMIDDHVCFVTSYQLDFDHQS